MTSNATPDVSVVVPMKPLSCAKTRLAGDLDSPTRTAAVLAMLECVVTAAKRSQSVNGVVVTGGDLLIEQACADLHVCFQAEEGDDLNSSLWAAVQQRAVSDTNAVAYLPGDLPFVTGGDVDALTDASAGLSRVVAVESEDRGTNALLWPRTQLFRPALGPQSFERHKAIAASLGFGFQAVTLPRIAFDVDTPSDFERALAESAEFASSIARWQAWLNVHMAGLPNV